VIDKINIIQVTLEAVPDVTTKVIARKIVNDNRRSRERNDKNNSPESNVKYCE